MSGHKTFDSFDEPDQEILAELSEPLLDETPEPDIVIETPEPDPHEEAVEILFDPETEPEPDLVQDPDVDHEPEPFDGSTWIQSLQLTLEETLLAVVETPEGDIFAVGSTASLTTHDWDAYVVRFDSLGNIIWDTALGGLGEEVAYGLSLDGEGGIFVVGSRDLYGDPSPPFLARLDGDGNLVWQRQLDFSEGLLAFGMTPLQDGMFFIYGTANVMGNQNGWGALVQADGTILWQEIMGHPSGENRILADTRAATWSPDGTILAAGTKASVGQGNEMWLWRLDLGGAIVWQKLVGGVRQDTAMAVLETADGSIYLAGTYGLSPPEFSRIWLVKLDASGALLWHRTLNASTYDVACSLTQTHDGHVVVAGWVGDMYSNDAVLAKFSAGGSLLWQKRYVLPMPSNFAAVIESRDHGLLAVGLEDSSLGLIMKLTPEGDVNGPCSLIEESAFPVETPEAMVRDAYGTTAPTSAVMIPAADSLSPRNMMQHVFCPE